MKVGQIVKNHSGRYSVVNDGKIYVCSAKGSLKIKSSGLVAGDFVEFDENLCVISKILSRKTYFIRPNVANIDAVNVVVALPPKPDFLMLDKLILTLIFVTII